MMKLTLMRSFALALPLLSAGAAMAGPGSIYATTSPTCADKVNVFGAKSDVYITGSGLPNGSYYIQVTEPGGTVLGRSNSASVVVTGGNLAQCYQVTSLVFEAPGFVNPGFATTSNPAPNYKVAISTDPTFPSNAVEHDNFKVTGEVDPPTATLRVNKFYDANANGVNDDAQPIAGWEVRINNGLELVRYTPVVNIVDPDTYTVTESAPVESNWVRTTLNPVIVTLGEGDDTTVEFGNVCTGAGGGRSHGFWGNKNGQATINDGGSAASEMALLSSLNLRAANGSPFDPADYAAFKSWNGSANAVNMAYMLSVQMSAVVLSVEAGFAGGNALVHAPGLLAYAPLAGLNAGGFITVNNLIALGDAELAVHGTAYAGAPWRGYQEALKNVFDKLANDLGFVQPAPCPFTFPTL
jgi:hypothetical protein